jgi:hypothetical protein
MKLFNSLSAVSFFSVTFATPQHSHSNSAENNRTSNNFDSATTDFAKSTEDYLSISDYSISSSADTIYTSSDFSSYNEQSTSTPTESTGSSENYSKLDGHLNPFGFGIRYLNTNAAVVRVRRPQVNNLRKNEISNVLGAISSGNIRGDIYSYSPYYPSYPSKLTHSTPPIQQPKDPKTMVVNFPTLKNAFD